MAETELTDVIQVMRQAHGYEISQYDESLLAKAVERRLAATAHSTQIAYLAYLSENSAEATTFSRSLTVSHSEFFRDPLVFAVLERLILPYLVKGIGAHGRSGIRIWSAGCAAGQEAYSVAMLLDELEIGRASCRERVYI